MPAERQTYWIIGGFISALLISLVAFPLILNSRMGAIIADLTDQADPAHRQSGQIQAALSHELSAILAFQATGESRYTDLYREQTDVVAQATGTLQQLTPELGPAVRRRSNRMVSAVESWHQAVKNSELTTRRYRQPEFLQLLFDNGQLLEQGQQATADFNDALVTWREEQRLRVARMAHLFTTVSIGFATLALIAILLVVNTLRSTQRAIHFRDEVLRVVSHDLRNPVSNIHLTAKILSLPSLTDERRQHLAQVIDRASQRMNRLIADLITAARLREGQEIPLSMQAEDPVSMVVEAYETFKMQAEAKSVELRLETPQMLSHVKADRHRVLQVLSNLLDNAIKFTPEGGRVVIRCAHIKNDVRFAVNDTGPGISDTDIPKIFDLFWQAKSSAHMGSGVGLAVVKAIVKQHNGTIWAESSPGVGATFFFTLPVAIENQAGPERKNIA
jgi:signal transduction histidine kinase